MIQGKSNDTLRNLNIPKEKERKGIFRIKLKMDFLLMGDQSAFLYYFVYLLFVQNKVSFHS